MKSPFRPLFNCSDRDGRSYGKCAAVFAANVMRGPDPMMAGCPPEVHALYQQTAPTTATQPAPTSVDDAAASLAPQPTQLQVGSIGPQRADELMLQMRVPPLPSGAGDQPDSGAVGGAAAPPYQCGTFLFPTVAQLRHAALAILTRDARQRARGGTSGVPASPLLTMGLRHVVGDSRALHTAHPGAFFQAASQFNGLEFPTAQGVPEDGIENYVYDRTQGPACAIACYAGTAARNYCIPVAASASKIQMGQTRDAQLNGLCDTEAVWREAGMANGAPVPWRVQNGYVEITNMAGGRSMLWLANVADLATAAHGPAGADVDGARAQWRRLIDAVRIGVHLDTEVTDARLASICADPSDDGPQPTCTPPVLVSQAYCSAASVGYSRYPQVQVWSGLGRLVLHAAYEATMYAAVVHADRLRRTGRAAAPVFLTKLGGGVFANPSMWIVEAVNQSLRTLQLLAAEAEAAAASGDDADMNTQGAAAQVPSVVPPFHLDVVITHFGRVDTDYLRCSVAP
jgi:hypothetical protein